LVDLDLIIFDKSHFFRELFRKWVNIDQLLGLIGRFVIF
jgi:hypothetical protein